MSARSLVSLSQSQSQFQSTKQEMNHDVPAYPYMFLIASLELGILLLCSRMKPSMLFYVRSAAPCAIPSTTENQADVLRTELMMARHGFAST